MEKILILDDDVDICHLLERFLSKNGYEVQSAHSAAKGLEMMEKNQYDVVLCDFRLGDSDGRQVLTRIKELNSNAQVIIITGYSDVKVAIEVIKMGAFEYITKPLLPDEILITIKNAIAAKKTHGNTYFASNNGEAPRDQEYKAAPKREQADIPKYITGESREAKELYRQIDLVAPTNYSIIIYGESGTGKESVALRIHEKSARRGKPFVAVDCGALPRDIAGSELFGHEKGSFTGAVGAKTGQFELANGGTLFLDEIANLSYDIQVSLLRVVQEKKLRKIGGNKEIDIDVRILIASNEKLSEAVAKGKFREDLYYRFNEFSINIPPLRERNKDIMLFAEHFLQKANSELNKNIRGFSPEVVNIFSTYSWPGNLREMNNIVKRAALLTDTEMIELSSLPQEMIYSQKFNFVAPVSSSFGGAVEPMEQIKKPEKTVNLKSAALYAECEMIMDVLRQVNFNKTKAAQLLNIDRKTLYNKMKALDLEP